MHGSVHNGNHIHNGAQLDCAVSYMAQHLQVLWTVDLDLWIRIPLLSVLLLLGSRVHLQPEGASHILHIG